MFCCAFFDKLRGMKTLIFLPNIQVLQLEIYNKQNVDDTVYRLTFVHFKTVCCK